jgi:thioesterase domain-containing protein
MVAELESSCPAKATSILLHRRISVSGGRNLFLAPDGFGSGAVFTALQLVLGRVKDVSVYALDSPFIKNKPDPDEPPAIEELAAIYVAEIKRRQPEGPYLLGGYSVGGVVAYEVARQLLEDGNEVEKLFLIDTACPTFATSLPSSLVDFLDSIERVGIANEVEIREKNRGRLITSDHFALARQQLVRYQVNKLPGRKIPQVVLVSARGGVDKQDKVARPAVLPEEQKIVDWFLDDRTDDGAFGWDELLGDVKVVRADGNHFSMMTPPMVSQLVHDSP